MNRQRVWGRRVVAILLGAGVTVASGNLRAQTNLFVAGISLKDEAPEHSRVWSSDVSQILLLPRANDPAVAAFSSGAPRGGRAADIATNHSAAVFQEPWSSIEDARMDALMHRIEDGGYGISDVQNRRSALSRAFDRRMNAIFAPEPIKIGHARLGFSPYTAIKRKNPLCLLNPVPLIFSW